MYYTFVNNSRSLAYVNIRWLTETEVAVSNPRILAMNTEVCLFVNDDQCISFTSEGQTYGFGSLVLYKFRAMEHHWQDFALPTDIIPRALKYLFVTQVH